MTRPNLALVDELLVPQVRVGDVVLTGENLYPRYRVIAVSGDRAWVRDLQYGTDHIIPVATVHTL